MEKREVCHPVTGSASRTCGKSVSEGYSFSASTVILQHVPVSVCVCVCGGGGGLSMLSHCFESS